MPTNLSGVLAPAVSTFASNGDVDLGAFSRNVRAHLAMGMDGIVVAGSSGEAALLDDEERAQLVSCARELVPADRWVIAGVGSESTRQTIARARVARESGADAVLVVAPHYYTKRMTEAALLTHFRAVADASPLPVLLYTIPVYVHFALPPSVVHALSLHENVIGMKDSAGDLPMLREYLQASSSNFTVLTGNGNTVIDALEMGARGAILAVALYAGALARTVYDAFTQGEVERARDAQTRLVPLARDIAAAFGPAGIKAAMDAVGLEGGMPRSPLLPVAGDDRVRIAELLEAAGVLPTSGELATA
jgi:4-hydroxy-2-oxoglutarate aldolase